MQVDRGRLGALDHYSPPSFTAEGTSRGHQAGLMAETFSCSPSSSPGPGPVSCKDSGKREEYPTRTWPPGRPCSRSRSSFPKASLFPWFMQRPLKLSELFCGVRGSTRVWTQHLTLARQELLLLEPLHQPFFVMGFFQDRSLELFSWGWLRTSILLISASCVTRITDMSHLCLVPQAFWQEVQLPATIHS
jgi:hypothetical protein